eukprot:5162478-Amphidinium_carterae.1
MADMYKKDTSLDYPKGGNEALVDALVRGVEKYDGCQVLLRAHVEEVLVRDGRASGVRLSDGRVFEAKDIVSNADYRVTQGFFQPGSAPELEEHLRTAWDPYPALKSFIHLHIGFRGDGLPQHH